MSFDILKPGEKVLGCVYMDLCGYFICYLFSLHGVFTVVCGLFVVAGFFCCRTWALELEGPVVTACGLQCVGS